MARQFYNFIPSNARLLAASTDGSALIEVFCGSSGYAHFQTLDFGRTWRGDQAAVLNDIITASDEEIDACELTDSLRNIYSRGMQSRVNAGEEFADPEFVFDTEVKDLDSMLADVQLPPEAYDADGKVIVHAQPSTEEDDEQLRKRVRDRWHGASDGQVLRRHAGALSWGSLDLADHDAVTGLLPVAQQPTAPEINRLSKEELAAFSKKNSGL